MLLVDVSLLLLYLCNQAVAAPPGAPAVSLSIVGAGTSKADPVLGATVQLKVACGAADAAAAAAAAAAVTAACPPWVRIDRVDGVADSTPYVRLVDEGYTFTWAPTFPKFIKPEWGVHTFAFGGSPADTPIAIVASGWSAEFNGTALAPNSTALTIYYSTAFEGSKSSMVVEDLGPGSVRLTLESAAAVPQFGTIRFDRYFASNLTASPPQFAADFFFNQHSGTGSIVRTFQEPGVYYWGVTPTFEGRAGGATAGGVFASCGKQKFSAGHQACEPATHPTALVVTGPNGEDGNQTVVPGFAGTVHHVKKLRTEHQFCIFERNLTVFSGVQVRVPLCRPGRGEQPPQPGFMSIVAPSWMTVHPLNNLTCARCRNAAKGPALNSTKVLAGGLVRYTFAALGNMQRPEDPEKPNARYVDGYLPVHWSTYNNYAPLYLSFAPSHEGKVAEISVMIHRLPKDGTTVPVSKWQTLQLRCIKAPLLKEVPKRLVTSITWATIGEDLFMDKPESDFWLETYKGLGFNTVPQKSFPNSFVKGNWTNNMTLVPSPTAPSYIFPAGRTSNAWKGLLYGPQVSVPNPSMGPSSCRKPPNATLLPAGLSAVQIKIEMTKWTNAYLFSNTTNHLDVAYNGIFSQHNSKHFCLLMKATQPDWVYIDDEAFGEGWNSWKLEAALSANAQARAMPGEKPLDLAWRMAAETMTDFTGCLATVAPKTSVHWYGYGPECPFPDGIFANAGISMGPSEYGQPHYLTNFADSLRQVKQQQVPMRGAGGSKPNADEPRHLLPWLTACTYGQMDAVQVWEEALHSFGSGATGFAFFGVFFHGCFDDPAKLLALSTATALATPFESLFLDGMPLIKGAVTATEGPLRAWSGVHLAGAHWLVLTPGDQHGNTAPSMLTVKVQALSDPHGSEQQSMEVCDLTTGETHAVTQTGTDITISALKLTRTTVLHMAAGAAAECTKLPADVWLPQPGYNFAIKTDDVANIVAAGGGGRQLDCLFGVNVHTYTGMYSNLSASMQAHLGTGVTSLYGLGHGSGNHAPTPAGFVDFIDHPTQLFEPNTSYWQAAWSATLASAPGYMAGVVNAELKRNSNPNSNVSHQDSGIVMLDYEPAYRPNWRFQTSARPDKRWEALMSVVHTPSLDLNWTTLVGWTVPPQLAGKGWSALSAAQQDELMGKSWNYFCQEYLSAGMDAIRAALPVATKLAVWNWPYKFGGSTATNATALHKFETWTAQMDWLWKKLDIFLPDLYPEFFVGTAATMPSVLSECTVPRGCTIGADGCGIASKSYADLYFSSNIAHMQRVRDRCHPKVKIYLSTWWHYMCAQKVLNCTDLDYYAQDANVAEPFEQVGHDGVIMWGSVGTFGYEDHDPSFVADYLNTFWGGPITKHCAPVKNDDVELLTNFNIGLTLRYNFAIKTDDIANIVARQEVGGDSSTVCLV
jgi:hypothetical protein